MCYFFGISVFNCFVFSPMIFWLQRKEENDLIYVSDLERVGFIFVVRSMVSRSHHKMLCNCDMMYAGRCYSAIICLYDNGKPRTLYDVLGKDKEEAKENFLYVKRMLKQYKTANTNGLGDIARSRVVLNIVSSLTSLFCFFCSII